MLKNVRNSTFPIINYVFFGLAVFFLLAWLVWTGYLKSEFMKLPDDFKYQAQVNSNDNFYDPKSKHYSGEVKSKSQFSYRVIAQKDQSLIIENMFDVRKYSGEPIFSVIRKYAIDPLTQEHVSGLGDHDRSGYLFAPRDLKKQDFTYWHVNYDAPALMKFQRQDTLYGLPVYVYSSTLSADQTESLRNLPDVGKTKGIVVDAQITLWVEPITGWLVAYQDTSVAWFYDLQTQQKIEPWNRFSNAFSEESVKEQVTNAQNLITKTRFLREFIPMTLLLYSIFFFVTYVALVKLGSRTIELIPVVVLFVGLFSTYFVHRIAEANINTLSATRFDTDTKALQNLLTKRLEIYSGVLESTVAFVNSSDFVSRDEWRLFVSKLDLQQEYPGIQGIGFAEVIQPKDLTTFEQTIQKEGFPDFKVTPVGERDIYTSIKYLEPFDTRNRRAFGFDMFQEPTRHDAMVRAALINEPVISKKVKLLQETENDVQAGFIMYVPVYSQPKNASDSAQVTGYVYAAFRMNDFMKGALENENFDIEMDIYDGSLSGESKPSEEALMFSTSIKSEDAYQKDQSLMHKNQVLHIYENNWTLAFSTPSIYGLDLILQFLPRTIIFFGVLLTLLLSLLSYGLTATRGKALSLAKQMTKELSEKTQELEKTNLQLITEVAERKKNQENLLEKSQELERINHLMVGRELEMKTLKEQLQKEKSSKNEAAN